MRRQPCIQGGLTTWTSIRDLRQWADAIAELDARGALPSRIVLVPVEAHAHALRVELTARAPRALAGTRFLTAAAAARAVLDGAGMPHTTDEETRRPLRVRKLLRSGIALQTYSTLDLQTAGWEEAFASTVEQLESGGLRPADLDRLDDPRACDLATLWRALDDDAGASWTTPRILAQAHELLAASPAAWPFDGPVLAVVDVGIDAIHARFLHAIPRLTVGILRGRPAHTRTVDRTRALFGETAAALLLQASEPARDQRELAILADYLFEPPDRLAAAGRRRSTGPDGSVSLELHAGVAEELDATARWVAEQVFDHETPLQDLAILVPVADPLAGLVADRISELPWPGEAAPVYLACGRPVTSMAVGARLLAVVRAIETWLPAGAMLELLPRLRLAGRDGHLSPKQAYAVVQALVTIGGTSTRPDDALQWRDRLGELDETLRPIAPSVEAIVAATAEVIAGASLATIWCSICDFAAAHLITPRDTAGIVDQLDGHLRELAADPVTAGVVGIEAVQLIARRLEAMRVDLGRFGEPAIYVGTIAGAAGLPFTAVRVLGLSEGAFPGTQREDPVLASELRRLLPPYTIAAEPDFTTARLHAFDHVVRGVRARLVLSAPRTDFDGTEREPASLLIEVAAAIARPNAVTGAPTPTIPSSLELERDAFRPARAAIVERRARGPLTEATWLDHVAGGAHELPSAWLDSVVTDPRAILERSSTLPGVLGPAPLALRVPGVGADQPLSASALRVLLTCPHWFLLERVLGYRPRSRLPASHRIDPPAYGALLHEVAEAFARGHGVAFGSRAHDLAYWMTVADELAVVAFEGYRRGHVLLGEGVVETERRRLLRDVRTFVEHDWDAGRPRTFVAAEQTFGESSPVSLPTAAGPLFISGRIDRIDLERGVTLVRDLKTGRARPRDRDHAEPAVATDLQLAVYAAVVERFAGEWGLPGDVAAAYVHTDRFAAERERSFRADPSALRLAGQRWLEVAASLIRDHSYVQTPEPDDCRYCSFAAVCGDGAHASTEHLRDATGGLALYRELKA